MKDGVTRGAKGGGDREVPRDGNGSKTRGEGAEFSCQEGEKKKIRISLKRIGLRASVGICQRESEGSRPRPKGNRPRGSAATGEKT